MPEDVLAVTCCGAAVAAAGAAAAAVEPVPALGMASCCPTLMTFGSLICDELAWKMSAHLNPVPWKCWAMLQSESPGWTV